MSLSSITSLKILDRILLTRFSNHFKDTYTTIVCDRKVDMSLSCISKYEDDITILNKIK